MEKHTKDEIDKIAVSILKDSKTYGTFPTPVNKITEYSELIVQGGIDIKSLEKKYSGFHISDALKSGIDKIRGILDRREKIIYIDTEQKASRQSFVKLHEVGHNVLPWQNEILQCIDDDSTLDPETNEEFEAEANYFASTVLFQNELFLKELKKYELGIPAAVQLSKQFGASFHATIRRYVEKSNKRCALLVLKDIAPKGTPAKALIRNSFHSPKFLKTFGAIDWPEEFGFTWGFLKQYYFGVKGVKTTDEITLIINGDDVKFRYHFFNNSFNAFILIFPIGENKPTRTKIILKDSAN